MPVKSAAVLVACVSALAVQMSAASDPRDLKHMRALHVTGNWGGNIRGIRTSVSGFLDTAPSISAGSVQTTVNRSSFVNAQGKTVTNDVAEVKLSIVVVGSSRSFTQAGFWVVQDVNTQDIFLQFRPSLDSSLAGIPGFTSDITFQMSPDGAFVDTSPIERATGAAFDYVAAVIANAPSLVQQGSFALRPPAAFDRPAVAAALQKLQDRVKAAETEYWEFLKSLNAEWLGISVAIFNDRISDPTVKVNYRPSGDTSRTIYTFDDGDLENFIARAKQLGFKIYLTLAFEPATLAVSATDPTCKTPQYKVNRWFFGRPAVVATDRNQICLNPVSWWWNPSHPDYSKNLAIFWNTYTQVAVKYGILSEQLGVDMYSLGTETDNLFRSRPAQAPYTNDFKPQLTQMVEAVRAVYSGLLTYDQHFQALTLPFPLEFGGGAGSANLFTDLKLDVVGVSAYFPLVNSPPTRVLSVSELETRWESIFERYLVPLEATNPDKPIVFTEFGYTDSVGAPAHAGANANAPEPPRNANGVTDGMLQQQNIFQAFFNVNERHNDLVRGAFVWGNEVFTNNARLCTEIGFNLYCKPSAKTISDIYAR